MPSKSLSHQVKAYYDWKNSLANEICRYQSWLQSNHLYSDDIDKRLQRGLNLLNQDELTIAFVGEYSRGKTELINALFFADYGQRMLPSQAGRTTMCPTELFCDKQSDLGYLKLLPIESRKDDTSLDNLKNNPSEWQSFTLDSHSPEEMKRTLDEVARTRSVSIKEARSLGFEESMLDHNPNCADEVIIPAWRHALISLHHPLLERGLRVLDTPGLNALGSEPELTISMIPNAHAVIFLLSADTGVTASDMSIWNDYIISTEADHSAGRFAVLNKIDVLWDDLQGETHTENSIHQVRKYTAEHLGLHSEDILPLSAKQALIGKVKNEPELVERSGLAQLETLLSERILSKKEQLISTTLVNDILGMLQNSQAILSSRMTSVNEDIIQMKKKGVSKDLIISLTEKTQKDYDYYYKKLITLRSSRRLMSSQAGILTGLVLESRLDTHIRKTREALKDSWTTVGMNKAMIDFFNYLEYDIHNLMSESRLAEKMVQSIYKRYTTHASNVRLHPAPFSIAQQIRALRILKEKTKKFRRNPKTILTEQTLVIKRFFSTMVHEARIIYYEIRKEAERWPNEALLPIIQYTLEQKKMLETQIHRLKSLNHTNKSLQEKRQHLDEMQETVHKQLAVADSIQRNLLRPPPSQKNQKVVMIQSAMNG
jgi:hypothetical protein